MKLKSVIAGLLASSMFAVSVPRAQATPAVLAPAALCASGVGCVIVGFAVVGGAVYYVWQANDGRRSYATPSGQVVDARVLMANKKKPRVSEGQLKINERVMTYEDCIKTIKSKKPDGGIVGGHVKDWVSPKIPGQGNAKRLVICVIGKDLP